MHPVLFDIHGFKIYTYGPIMALGFMLAFVLLYHIVSHRGDDVEFYMDLYLYLIIGGVVGAKVLYSLIEYEEFFAHPLRMLNCRNGGLVWYGGVIADFFVVLWYARRRGQSVLRVMDNLVAPLALGLAIGRWGCLMGGCCFGKVCSSSVPWAIVYPEGANPLAGLPVHPTPIYESLASLLICAVIYAAVRKEARAGIPALLWFTLYPLARFTIEFFRGDDIRGYLIQTNAFNLSTSQTISLVVVLGAAAGLVYVSRRPEPAADSQPAKEEPKAKEPAAKKKDGGK